MAINFEKAKTSDKSIISEIVDFLSISKFSSTQTTESIEKETISQTSIKLPPPSSPLTTYSTIITGTVLTTDLISGADLIQWNIKNMANDCSFKTNDFIVISSSRDDCMISCIFEDKCTHFTWDSSNGGTCHHKSGLVYKYDAIKKKGTTCGIFTTNTSLKELKMKLLWPSYAA